MRVRVCVAIVADDVSARYLVCADCQGGVGCCGRPAHHLFDRGEGDKVDIDSSAAPWQDRHSSEESILRGFAEEATGRSMCDRCSQRELQ